MGLRLRIVLPVHYFPPRYIGGAELYTLALAHRLQALGHDVVVISVESLCGSKAPCVTAEHDLFEGITVYRLALTDSATYNFTDSFDNAAVGEWFRQFLFEWSADLIHFQGAYRLSAAAIIAGYSISLPTVITLHDYWFVCPKLTLLKYDRTLCGGPNVDECFKCCSVISSLYPEPETHIAGDFDEVSLKEDLRRRMGLLRDCLVKSDALIAPSKCLKAKYVELGVPDNLITVIPIGLRRAFSKKGVRLNGQRPIKAAYISHLLPHKGADVLIDALIMLSERAVNISVTIYGSCETSPGFANGLANRIALLPSAQLGGSFQPAELDGILADIDIVIVPSLWLENSPLVILEALAMSIPVLASNCGSLPEFIQDGVNGLLFERDNPTDLARKLLDCIDQPGLLQKLSAGSSYRRSVETEVAEIEQIYQRVVSPPRL